MKSINFNIAVHIRTIESTIWTLTAWHHQLPVILLLYFYWHFISTDLARNPHRNAQQHSCLPCSFYFHHYLELCTFTKYGSVFAVHTSNDCVKWAYNRTNSRQLRWTTWVSNKENKWFTNGNDTCSAGWHNLKHCCVVENSHGKTKNKRWWVDSGAFRKLISVVCMCC